MAGKGIIGYEAVSTIPLGVSLIKMKGVLIWQRNANASYAFIVKKIQDLTGAGIATTKELM